MPVLFDVSKVITVFQRLCHFAEEFTEEHREPLIAALTRLFREDLDADEEVPNVNSMISSLVRRLRRTLDRLVDAETELIVAVKDNTRYGSLREKLTRKLRDAFERGRTECRNHFGQEKADHAGFPARLAVNSSALLRQAKVVSLKMRESDFDLGEPLAANSTTTVESILEMYEPEVEALRTGIAKAMRRRVRIQGKQVTKDKELRDFRSTYSLFVSMVRSSFRLAGEDELAKRLTLTQPSRRIAPDNDTPTDTVPPPNATPPPTPEPPQAPDPAETDEDPEPPL